MYLNPNLEYKVLDSNGNEKPRSYFKLNLHKSIPTIGKSQHSKKLIMDILHSLNELTDPIKVSCYLTLLSFGMGLAAINETEAPSQELSLFVLFAAQDCAIRATNILSQIGVGPSNSNLSFCGDVIAAGMAEYWQKGAECCGYHELFFNGLFVVLYGGLGNTSEGILRSVKDYHDYHFERPYVVEDEDPDHYDLMALEPGIIDEISYAFFPNSKRNAETTPAKNRKKQKSSKHAK